MFPMCPLNLFLQAACARPKTGFSSATEAKTARRPFADDVQMEAETGSGVLELIIEARRRFFALAPGCGGGGALGAKLHVTRHGMASLATPPTCANKLRLSRTKHVEAMTER